MDTADRIRDLVAPLVDDAGAELYDVEHLGGVLRVTVDRAQGGVDMGIIGGLTREISRLLDDVDPIAGHYTLEVSSPGLERPLRRPEHFTRAIGTTVAIKSLAGTEGDRRVRGQITAADDDAVWIAPEGAEPGDVRRFAFANIERARTVFEWGPQPKPGGPRAPAPSTKQKRPARS